MTPRAAGDRLDRPARIRQALRQLVAANGFHGASMSAVAKEADVATGTAYVHYGSKDELVIEAYIEAKAALSAAAVVGVDPDDEPARRFHRLWRNIHDHLGQSPDRARFLVQVDHSPFAERAHQRVMEQAEDPLQEAVADMMDLFVELPLTVLYELGVGPAIHVVATGEQLDESALDRLADACWRAITR